MVNLQAHSHKINKGVDFVRICSLEELSKKEVISCMDCTRLGNIIDVNIHLDTAQVVSVVSELPSPLFCFHRNIIVIPWECIKKIGDDLIIADYILPPAPPKNEARPSFLSRLFRN